MTTRTITFPFITTLALAPAGCEISRSTAPTTAAPVEAAHVGQPVDPTCLQAPSDPDRGLDLYYEKDGSWSYRMGSMTQPQPISAGGLCFDEKWGMAPGPDGIYELALDVNNCGYGRTGTTCSACVDAKCGDAPTFDVFLMWNGAKYQDDERSIAPGHVQTFPLVVKQGASNDTAEWHVVVGGDPVIKISYQFPVKPAGQ